MLLLVLLLVMLLVLLLVLLLFLPRVLLLFLLLTMLVQLRGSLQRLYGMDRTAHCKRAIYGFSGQSRKRVP